MDKPDRRRPQEFGRRPHMRRHARGEQGGHARETSNADVRRPDYRSQRRDYVQHARSPKRVLPAGIASLESIHHHVQYTRGSVQIQTSDVWNQLGERNIPEYRGRAAA